MKIIQKLWFIAITALSLTTCDNGSTPHAHKWRDWVVTIPATCKDCTAASTGDDYPALGYRWIDNWKLYASFEIFGKLYHDKILKIWYKLLKLLHESM